MASLWVELLSAVLLFCLVFGMSATVELSHMQKQIHNWRALLIGVGMQFLILPFCGFCVVKIFQLPAEVGITLLVITSSPGGSYSNWFCSLFNAELALSVTMTACSTILSCIMLPLNLIVYTQWTYSAVVVQSLDWRALFVSLLVVLGGIAAGLLTSHHSTPDTLVATHTRANRLGNLAGLALILLSFGVSSSDHQAALWDQDMAFYTACALPVIIGLVTSVSLATHFQLDKPERVAVSIESCLQNTGIATTVALTMFETEQELATAIGVPLYYGIVEAVVIITFCLTCWRLGWTKAPPSDNLFKVIYNSYEVTASVATNPQEETAIEVVLSCHGGDDGDESGSKTTTNMIFSQTSQGDYIVDEQTLQDIESQKVNVVPDDDEPTELTSPDPDDEEGDKTETITVTAVGEAPALRQKRRLFGARATAPLPTADDDEAAAAYSETGEDSASSRGAARARSALSTLRARATGYRAQAPLQIEDDEHDPSLHNPVHQDTQIAVILENSSDEVVGEGVPPRRIAQVAATVRARRRGRKNKYATITTLSPTSHHDNEDPHDNDNHVHSNSNKNDAAAEDDDSKNLEGADDDDDLSL